MEEITLNAHLSSPSTGVVSRLTAEYAAADYEITDVWRLVLSTAVKKLAAQNQLGQLLLAIKQLPGEATDEGVLWHWADLRYLGWDMRDLRNRKSSTRAGQSFNLPGDSPRYSPPLEQCSLGLSCETS